MKLRLTLTTISIIAGLMTGCNKPSGTGEATTMEDLTNKAKEMQEKAKAAGEEVKQKAEAAATAVQEAAKSANEAMDKAKESMQGAKDAVMGVPTPVPAAEMPPIPAPTTEIPPVPSPDVSAPPMQLPVAPPRHRLRWSLNSINQPFTSGRVRAERHARIFLVRPAGCAHLGEVQGLGMARQTAPFRAGFCPFDLARISHTEAANLLVLRGESFVARRSQVVQTCSSSSPRFSLELQRIFTTPV